MFVSVVCGYPQSPEGDVKSPGIGLKSSFELLDKACSEPILGLIEERPLLSAAELALQTKAYFLDTDASRP